MLKNNNTIAEKRISRRSMKANLIRNVFSVLAIVLTTLMFTAVFTICYSIYKNMDTMLLRQQGTRSTIYLDKPTEEQLHEVQRTKKLRAVGIRISAGYVPVDENGDVRLYLDYYDKTEYEKNFLPAVTDVKGHYPVQEDEVMLSQSALSAIEIGQPKQNMEILFTMEDGTKKVFRLSGWYKDYTDFSGNRQVFVSKIYVERAGLTMEENGCLSISAVSGKSQALLEELERKVTLSGEQEFIISYDARSESKGNAVVLVALAAMIALIIVASGYLLIYNVMYISVTKDIRFYGMLKTIGASPKQIKRIVKLQVFRLSVYGIPIGIILGSALSFVAMPYVMDMFSTGYYTAMPRDILFNPVIYVATVLFDLLTVQISCRKPAKLAGRVSPVEALKYNGINEKSRIKAKKTGDGGKLYKMAWRNVFRERKRSIIVFTSLFMGMMAFLAVNTFMEGIRLENYVDKYLPYDYNIYLHSGNESMTEEEMTASAVRLAENIQNIDGVTLFSMNRATAVYLDFDKETYMPFLEQALEDVDNMDTVDDLASFYEENTETDMAYSTWLFSVSTDVIEKHNERAEQKIDVEKFERGEICILGFVDSKEQAAYMKGRRLEMTEKTTGRHLDIETGVCMTREDSFGLDFVGNWIRGGAPSCIIVSDKVMAEMNDNASVDTITASCEPEKEPQVTAELSRLTANNDIVIMSQIKSELMQEFKTSMSSLNILINAISLILILIGIINFINVMLTGVYTRRKELAVMECVGMTKIQVKRMLMLEGAYYGLITVGMIATLGSGIMLVVARLTKIAVDYAVISYPWMQMMVASLLIMAICVFVPACIYKSVSGESVTERIRVEE